MRWTSVAAASAWLFPVLRDASSGAQASPAIGRSTLRAPVPPSHGRFAKLLLPQTICVPRIKRHPLRTMQEHTKRARHLLSFSSRVEICTSTHVAQVLELWLPAYAGRMQRSLQRCAIGVRFLPVLMPSVEAAGSSRCVQNRRARRASSRFFCSGEHCSPEILVQREDAFLSIVSLQRACLSFSFADVQGRHTMFSILQIELCS